MVVAGRKLFLCMVCIVVGRCNFISGVAGLYVMVTMGILMHFNYFIIINVLVAEMAWTTSTNYCLSFLQLKSTVCHMHTGVNKYDKHYWYLIWYGPPTHD